MSQTTVNSVKKRIFGHGSGWCFTPNDFIDLGSSEAIRVTLFRLESLGLIVRHTHGLYELPKKHKSLGILPPDINKIVSAIAQKNKIKIQPSGAYAANLLGLSEQVPGKTVFLTNGASRSFKIGNSEVVFKKTTPKNMKTAGKFSGLVIQALRHIGKGNVSDGNIKQLKKNINKENKKSLQTGANLAPVWISKIIRNELLKD
ncbi:MAG: hypothetical protein HOO06_06800 [Bdellovibrionaceae bacterium]|jgi:hypothetical protein|nr:hypothetical protein [Pseudobdellovibrionaceae bacterium]